MESNTQQSVTPNDDCSYNTTLTGLYCNATWDTIMCWPATPAGKIAQQPCPPEYGAGPNVHAYRTCSEQGEWVEPESYKPGDWSLFGNSDHSECIALHEDLKHYFYVPEAITPVTVADYGVYGVDIVSLALLTMALLSMAAATIAMHCIIPRTIQQVRQYKLFRHLFATVILEVTVALLQTVLLINYRDVIFSEPVFCESLISLSKYLNLAACTWLLIQAHHSQLIVKSGQLSTSGYMTYFLIGWGIPLLPTVVWVVTLSFSHKVPCWEGHKFLVSMWITEVPKSLMLSMALTFCIRTIWCLAKDSDRRNSSCCVRRLFYNSIISLVFCSYVFISFMVILAIHNFVASSSQTGRYIERALETSKGIVLSVLFLVLNSDIRKYVLRVRRISDDEPTPITYDSEV